MIFYNSTGKIIKTVEITERGEGKFTVYARVKVKPINPTFCVLSASKLNRDFLVNQF